MIISVKCILKNYFSLFTGKRKKKEKKETYTIIMSTNRRWKDVYNTAE